MIGWCLDLYWLIDGLFDGLMEGKRFGRHSSRCLVETRELWSTVTSVLSPESPYSHLDRLGFPRPPWSLASLTLVPSAFSCISALPSSLLPPSLVSYSPTKPSYMLANNTMISSSSGQKPWNPMRHSLVTTIPSFIYWSHSISWNVIPFIYFPRF